MSKLNVKTMKKSTLDHLITFAMVIVAYLVVQILIAAGVLSSLMQGLLVPMCTYSIVAIGLNLCVGYLGELSIGHAGFMCVGAFSSAFATKLLQDVIPNQILLFIIVLIIGTAVAAFFGFLIGIPVLRLRGDYLAIVTLAFGEIIKNVIEESLDYVECPYDAEVNVLLTDNAGIHQINLDMRGIDNPTDVLSFPMCDFETPGDFSHLEETPEEYFDPDTGELLMGDIVISVDKVKEQAEKYGHSQTRELAFLVAHSMLHLSGYDHMEDEERIQMEDMQREILERRGYRR